MRTLEANAELAATRSPALKQGPTEFFQVDIGDGVKLDAWMMKPADFDPTKKYPVLFYVYGEPWDQTVRDSYGGANWLWHLMLTQQGYIVASVDNRGTPGPEGATGARRCTTRSARCACTSSRPPRWPSRGGRTWTRRASASGVGAAAGRRRSC